MARACWRGGSAARACRIACACRGKIRRINRRPILALGGLVALMVMGGGTWSLDALLAR